MQSFLSAIRGMYLPNKVIILLDPKTLAAAEGCDDVPDGCPSFLLSQNSFLRTFKQLEGEATAYVCQNYSCSLPVTQVEHLMDNIKTGKLGTDVDA